MDANTAINILWFMDRVQVQWVKENAVYGQCVQVLSQIINAEQQEEVKEEKKK